MFIDHGWFEECSKLFVTAIMHHVICIFKLAIGERRGYKKDKEKKCVRRSFRKRSLKSHV